MKLYPLNVYRLDNEDVFALSKTTVEIADGKKTLFDATSQAGLVKLTKNTNQLADQLNITQAHQYTEQLRVLDYECDRIYGEVKNTLRTEENSLVDTDKAAKARTFIEFLQPYWNANKLPMNTQSKLLGEMFGKYTAAKEPETPPAGDAGTTAVNDLQALAADLGIDKGLNVLQPKNEEMGQVWKQRNDMLGDIEENDSASKLSHETGKCYNRFCSALVTQQEFVPNEELAALLSDLDRLRVKYATIVAAKETAAKKKKEEEKK
ncbi:MAG TPA: hypothetical protein DDZ96_07895 [Porphyromonadaceae bacterium]|jgi:hypothetical protein|uniref:hypothetical protein n=1 Tax=Limibacterium fermenti TaxID=3229863 RepID=UPI000E8BCC34|nr:hypothetical protein [Porphyromonadaceae bacterium]HBK30381.1 hypothetical protein [Porphyromonadaceae bacterium]HBL33725.1 hypothetical protein [Porphyromonadaceae bacterium]HBX45182.1 hypothetical protein [Porphyromonadaceae bacterium]